MPFFLSLSDRIGELALSHDHTQTHSKSIDLNGNKDGSHGEERCEGFDYLVMKLKDQNWT